LCTTTLFATVSVGAVSVDPVAHNRVGWDRQVELGNEWSRPVSSETIAKARAGDWSVVFIGSPHVHADGIGSGVGLPARPWRGDLRARVSVAADRDRSWPEHCHFAVADLPTGRMSAAQ
jgi:hypothetical protein